MIEKQQVKILYCIDQLNIGGTEKQLLAIIERLDRKLFEPYLVCLRSTVYFDQCTVNCKKKVLGVSSLFSISGIVKLFLFSRYLRREKIDIVQTFFFDSTVFGVLAAKLARVNKVISCRRDMGFWYTPKLLKVLRIINMMTDRFLVNSQAIKKNVVEKEHVLRNKVDTIYNGIDLEPFLVQHDTVALRTKFGIPAEGKIVGIVANLNRQVKRVDLFIEVAAQVLQRERGVFFIIVGEGDLRSQLEHQVNELGIFNKIFFVGLQPNVIPYLQLFDIGVLTSESEGFANSVIEYMAAGIPTVAIDVGGTREIIKNDINGCLTADDASHSFAKKICSLLEKEGDRLRMGKAARKEVLLNYSWDKKIKEMESYYCTLLKD